MHPSEVYQPAHAVGELVLDDRKLCPGEKLGAPWLCPRADPSGERCQHYEPSEGWADPLVPTRHSISPAPPGWQLGQKNAVRFPNTNRHILVEQRRQGSWSLP